MRIIDQKVWNAAKARQQSLAYETSEPGENALNERRRPKHLFAGLVKCGCCGGGGGGGYTMISKDLLGCATSQNKGTCDNRLNIRRDALEASVLSGLRTHLMEPELFKEFCDEFTREMNQLRIERGAGLAAMRDELPRIERELGKLLVAIKAGGPIEAIVEDLKRLEARKAELKDQLANAEEPPPRLHPNMAEIYRQRIAALYEGLQNEDGKAEAAEVFRTLVDQVTLVPDEAELAIVLLRGDLAAILRFAANKKNPDVLSEAGVLGALLSQESLVAGTGRKTPISRTGSSNQRRGSPDTSKIPCFVTASSWILMACSRSSGFPSPPIPTRSRRVSGPPRRSQARRRTRRPAVTVQIIRKNRLTTGSNSTLRLTGRFCRGRV